MSNDINKIKKLRQSTGTGFKDCSAALQEGNGNIEKAIEILRVKGISKASKKMSRDANEGVVAVSGDEKKLTLIEVNCETDFVAKNDNFVTFVKELSELNLQSNANIDNLKKSKMKNGDNVDQNLVNLIAKVGEKITIGRTKIINSKGTKNYTYLHTVVRDNLSKLAVIVSIESQDNSNLLKQFGKKLAMHIAASNPLSIDINSIDKTILQKEEKLISEELKNLGKSSEIIKKISIGKINKFKEENALLSQFWVMDPKKKVQNIIKELNIPDLKIKDFFRIKIGE
jgi:elongation factor Ts